MIFDTLTQAFAPESIKTLQVKFADDTLEFSDEGEYVNNDLYVSFGDFGAVFDVMATMTGGSALSVYNDPQTQDYDYRYDIKLLSVIDDSDVELALSSEYRKEIEEKGYNYIVTKLRYN